MSTISGFNALMSQAYNNPTTDIENQQRRAQVNALQMQQQREQAQIPLIQAQTQGAQIQNQLAQQGLNDNSLLRSLYGSHAQDNWSDPDTYNQIEKEFIQQGGSYQGLSGFRDQNLKTQQAWLNMDEARVKFNENIISQSGDIAQSLRDIDPAKRLSALPIYSSRWASLHNGQQLTDRDISDDNLDFLIGASRSQEAQLKRKKELQEMATSAATQAETQAKLPGIQAESQMKTAEAAAMKNLTPQAISQMVDSEINPAKFEPALQQTVTQENQTTKAAAARALSLGLGPKGVDAAIKDGSDRIARMQTAIQQQRVTNLPISQANLQMREQQMLQQSYQANSSELDRLQQPITQNLSTIQRLQETLDQKTPASDATVSSQLVRLMGGGEGSLAGTEAIAKEALGGMTVWTGLKEHLNKWSLDPNHGLLPDEYRNQVQNLVDTIAREESRRMQTIMQARTGLAGASGPEQHRVIMSNTQNKLGQSYTAKQAAPKGIPDAVKSVLATAKPGIHTLSDGTKWMKAADGTITPQ